jgi:hypothetical protein
MADLELKAAKAIYSEHFERGKQYASDLKGKAQSEDYKLVVEGLTNLKKLRDAGVSEAQALAVMPKIRSYCMYALNEYDQAYLVIEEMVMRDGRSPEHDQFIADKGAFLLRQMEAGIAELVGFAIRGAIRDAETPPPAQTVIPPVRYKSHPPNWQIFLSYVVKLVIWLLGIPASFLLTTFFIGWDNWAFLGPISLVVLWLLVRFSWWELLFPLTAIGGALVFFNVFVPEKLL